jgi:hypothetical protein
MQAGGFTLANADEVATGRYGANCKPARAGVGCICDTDFTSQVSTLSRFNSETGGDIDHIQNVELRRLVEWMRLTCAAITQPRELR